MKGQQVVPRDVFIAAVHPKLHKPEGKDLVALLVTVSGSKDGKDVARLRSASSIFTTPFMASAR